MTTAQEAIAIARIVDCWREPISVDMLAKIIDAALAAQPSQPPVAAISTLLNQAMDEAVRNGANSVSMPDEYVEIAAWLAGAQPSQPLTDEQILDQWSPRIEGNPGVRRPIIGVNKVIAFARAIEAAHGIKKESP